MMSIIQKFIVVSTIASVLVVGSSLVPMAVPSAEAVLQSLEIIAPRAGLTTANRYYKAYPGLLYEVPIAVIGGTFPNTYSLISGPAGMSINAATGVLSWPNPTTSGSPHTVAVQVSDAASGSASVTWTITVTTSGFVFVDASAPGGGTGSLASPFNSIDDWYITKANTTYSGQFIYYYDGTYNTNAAPVEDGWRLAMPSHKPTVWLAYPGESPVINVVGSHISPYPSISNWYMEGLIIRNMDTDFGVRIDSGGDDMVFYRNTFDDMPVGAGGGGTNASGVMIANGGSKSNYVAFVDNTFSDFLGGTAYGILGYYADKVLVERNTFSNITASDSKGVGPKMNNSHWYIRDNRIHVANGQAIWVDSYPTTGNVEAAYNLARGSMGLWVGQETTGWGPFESYRNTYVGTVELSNFNTGPAGFNADIIVNSSGSANHIDYSGGQTPTITNVLSGASAAGILDSDGNLQGSYRTTYLGTRGYERGTSDTTPPAAPIGLGVQ